MRNHPVFSSDVDIRPTSHFADRLPGGLTQTYSQTFVITGWSDYSGVHFGHGNIIWTPEYGYRVNVYFYVFGCVEPYNLEIEGLTRSAVLRLLRDGDILDAITAYYQCL